MDTDDQHEPDEDFVEICLIRWGLVGFAVGLAALCVAGFYVARLIASFLFPGTTT